MKGIDTRQEIFGSERKEEKGGREKDERNEENETRDRRYLQSRRT